ncbi:hypothetical protein C8J57DRAFT_1721694 [Mycena rebaudengoi]|nr:hypothetical protein C8J57DRAFT_1721694 [Mycena rebaudengoi]
MHTWLVDDSSDRPTKLLRSRLLPLAPRLFRIPAPRSLLYHHPPTEGDPIMRNRASPNDISLTCVCNVDSAQNGRRRASTCDAGDAAKPAHTDADLMCGAALHSARRLHAEPRDPALVPPRQQSASADRTFAKLATSAAVLVCWCCGAASVPPGGDCASVGASRARRERGRARFQRGSGAHAGRVDSAHQACAASTSACAEDCAPSYNAAREGGVGGPHPRKSIRGPCRETTTRCRRKCPFQAAATVSVL